MDISVKIHKCTHWYLFFIFYFCNLQMIFFFLIQMVKRNLQMISSKYLNILWHLHASLPFSLLLPTKWFFKILMFFCSVKAKHFCFFWTARQFPNIFVSMPLFRLCILIQLHKVTSKKSGDCKKCSFFLQFCFWFWLPAFACLQNLMIFKLKLEVYY